MDLTFWKMLSHQTLQSRLHKLRPTEKTITRLTRDLQGSSQNWKRGTAGSGGRTGSRGNLESNGSVEFGSLAHKMRNLELV